MYINNKIINSSKFLLGVLSVFLIASSCEEDDVFTGAPQGPFTVLRGSITTPETEVAGSQSFPVTISLGDNLETPEADLLTFPMDVSVEAITIITNSNKRTRKSFIIPAGQNSLESTMNAPSAEASTMPFNLSVKMYLSAIASVPEAEELRGFEGKQYTIVSDTINLGYGDIPLTAINAKKLGVRLDFPGPFGTGANVNNLNIVLNKNGSTMPSQSSGQGVSTSATRPIYGTLSAAGQYETINFYDVKQEGLKISNQTYNDSVAGIYTVKAPNSSAIGNDKPHNFKVGDEVTLENINGNGSAPVVVEVATVADAYTFTFNYTGVHLFTANPTNVNSFYLATLVDKGDWSPFLAYAVNNRAKYNGVFYYAKRAISASPAGNIYPNLDTDTWTNIRPNIDWANVAPLTWGNREGYESGTVVDYLGVLYVSTNFIPARPASDVPQLPVYPAPSGDSSRWTLAVQNPTVDAQTYTSTDTYTMGIYAKTLNGASTGTTPVDMPYRIAIRFPDETSKVYTGTLFNLTIGTAANAIPKLQIVKTTTEGVSTYVVSSL